MRLSLLLGDVTGRPIDLNGEGKEVEVESTVSGVLGRLGGGRIQVEFVHSNSYIESNSGLKMHIMNIKCYIPTLSRQRNLTHNPCSTERLTSVLVLRWRP